MPWALTRHYLTAHWHTQPWIVDWIWQTDPGQVLETLEILELLGEAERKRTPHR